MKNNKVFYIFMTFLFILSIISISGSMKSKRIVEVLNKYPEIDKIIIIKEGVEYEVPYSQLDKYKDALEPRHIISMRKSKETTEKLVDKVIDIEYYIGNKKLLDSSVYSLSSEPEEDFMRSTAFRVDGKLYIMIVRKEYRTVEKVDRDFLSKHLN